jgi:hypothetical protein
MKLTSKYVEADDSSPNTENDNGVPDNSSLGVNGRRHDFAQGYGFIDAEKAVALALTLETLRYTNPKATVWDALHSYKNIITRRPHTEETNILTTGWQGEWSYLNDGRENTVFTNHPKKVYIPNETTTIILDLSFEPVSIPELQLGTISLTLDYDNDGNSDWQSDLSFSSSLNGVKHDEIDVTGGMEGYKGTLWTFNVIGQIISWPTEDIITSGNPLWVGEKDYREGLIEYQVAFQAVMDVTSNETTEVFFEDLSANVGWLQFGEPTGEVAVGIIEKQMNLFDLSEAKMPEDVPYDKPPEEGASICPILLVLALILAGVWAFMRRRAKKPIIPPIGPLNKRSSTAPAAKDDNPQEVEPLDEAGRTEPPTDEAVKTVESDE